MMPSRYLEFWNNLICAKIYHISRIRSHQEVGLFTTALYNIHQWVSQHNNEKKWTDELCYNEIICI